MAKAYVCRAAEWVTREAMQIHGGMGYAEEYAVSRYFVDARVLSIFEGADETLCLKVIARRLLDHRSRIRANHGRAVAARFVVTECAFGTVEDRDSRSGEAVEPHFSSMWP
jgi:hypothetical protein